MYESSTGLSKPKTEPVIGDLSENCGVMIRELFLPVRSAQESIDMEIFFPLWAPGSGKALKSKLLKYLDSDTLSHYSGYEMTASLLSANCNFRVFFSHTS